MFEVRFHGRGGQGVKMSAIFLARTAFLSGYKTQDFAMYGAERRGAPVTSFTRFDKRLVSERGYIFEPDAVVVLDETLNFGIMEKGLKRRGFMIINSHRAKKYFKKTFKLKHRFYCVPATDIAIETIGKPIANVAILGSLIKKLKLSKERFEEAIKIELTDAGHPEDIQKNIEAARKCYKLIK